MIEISICTANLNTKQLLRQYLQSLYENMPKLDFEVIIVDNGSNDGSVEMLRAEFPQVKLIANPSNVGFAKANNQALWSASGHYLTCLNSDIIVLPGALAAMHQFMEDHPDVGAVACKLLNADGSLQYSCGHAPTFLGLAFNSFGLNRLFPRSKFFARFLMTYWDHDEERQVDQPAGACLMIRRQALEEVGFFDERFFVYFEDVDWCYRAKQAGWPIYFIPYAQMIHLGGQTSGHTYDIRIKTRAESELRFVEKYLARGLQLPLMRALLLFEMIWRSLITVGAAMFSAKWRSRARKSLRWNWAVAAMCVKGTWRQAADI